MVRLLGYGLVLSLYITFAKRKSSDRYAKYRPLGLIGLVVVILSSIGFVAFTPTRQMAQDGILGTQTPSLTPTLIPTTTATPLPQLERADILVAEFDSRHATRTRDVAHRLEDELETAFRLSGIRDVVIQVFTRPVGSEQEAQAAANETGSRTLQSPYCVERGCFKRIRLGP